VYALSLRQQEMGQVAALSGQVCFMTRTPALQASSRRHSVASNVNRR
jgi:hypothetical protein